MDCRSPRHLLLPSKYILLPEEEVLEFKLPRDLRFSNSLSDYIGDECTVSRIFQLLGNKSCRFQNIFLSNWVNEQLLYVWYAFLNIQ